MLRAKLSQTTKTWNFHNVASFVSIMLVIHWIKTRSFSVGQRKMLAILSSSITRKVSVVSSLSIFPSARGMPTPQPAARKNLMWMYRLCCPACQLKENHLINVCLLYCHISYRRPLQKCAELLKCTTGNWAHPWTWIYHNSKRARI